MPVATAIYQEAMDGALDGHAGLARARDRIICCRSAPARAFSFKMDFAEAEYISRVRSGVKGHFSYRQVAWEMKLKMEQLEPELGRLMEATPPWVEDIAAEGERGSQILKKPSTVLWLGVLAAVGGLAVPAAAALDGADLPGAA